MSAAASPSPVSTPASVRIVSVDMRNKRERERFIRAQWNFYRGNKAWVPPLLMERRAFLDPQNNPFFENAEAAYWLAEQGGEIVGRIAACEDRNYNKFQSTKTCYFGFYESIDDQGVTHALVAQARTWARSKGLTDLLGPMNFSTNHDCGLLIDSFERPPYLLMTYNPPYYQKLLEAEGMTKAKDLLSWDIDPTKPPPEREVRVVEKLRKKHGLVVRPINMKDLDGEIARLERVYNDAWEKNWGFVPMTDHEFQHMAKDLKQLAIPELCLIAEIDGEPVAFAMTLPDINRALAKIDGKLFNFGLPIGAIRLLLAQRKIRACRLVTLGVRKGFRRRGIDAILYLDTQRNAQKIGYTEGEIGWTLEDNDLINRAIVAMGGTKGRTYRIYSVGA